MGRAVLKFPYDMVRRGAADFDKFPLPTPTSRKITQWHQVGTHKSTKRPYSAYAAVLSNPLTVHVVLPNNTCGEVAKTSATSRQHNCDYATNAGFFDITHHKCIGNVVSDGQVVDLPGSDTAQIGILQEQGSGNFSFITGYLPQDLKGLKFLQLVSGAGWLVRNGKSYVRQARDLNATSGFVLEKAPRVALGFYAKNSSVLMLELDGEEDINAGPDLFEMAELLVELGVDSAVNLDGGGSAVTVSKGEVISKPTCDDTPVICERRVTSIICFKP